VRHRFAFSELPVGRYARSTRAIRRASYETSLALGRPLPETGLGAFALSGPYSAYDLSTLRQAASGAGVFTSVPKVRFTASHYYLFGGST
jgi:hypothetical protein